jgi:hypothetical protein
LHLCAVHTSDVAITKLAAVRIGDAHLARSIRLLVDVDIALLSSARKIAG